MRTRAALTGAACTLLALGIWMLGSWLTGQPYTAAAAPTVSASVTPVTPVSASCTINPTTTAPSGATVATPVMVIKFTNEYGSLVDVSASTVLLYNAAGQQVATSDFLPGGPLDDGQTQAYTSDPILTPGVTSCRIWFRWSPDS